jgi:sulfatase maturation enzyme AslB (radical SAM superfamily)
VDAKLKGKFCPLPFKNVVVNTGGQVHLCYAEWNGRPIGDLRTTRLQDLWNSQAALEIRESILDGSFKYCNSKACPLISNNELPDIGEFAAEETKVHRDDWPQSLVLCYDRSCNLTCPSCRKERIDHREGSSQYNMGLFINERLIMDLFSEPHDRALTLNVTGSGDPFASATFRRLLENIDGSKFPRLRIDFQTNGTLFTPAMWERLARIHRNIGTVQVSIDAATAGTYNKVRRGGQWLQLLKNVDFLVSLRKAGKIKQTIANIVVQKNNFREVPVFIRRFLNLGFDAVYMFRLQNWGTWKADGLESYDEQCVWRREHVDFKEFQSIFSDSVFHDPRVNLGHFQEFQKEPVVRNKFIGLLHRDLD